MNELSEEQVAWLFANADNYSNSVDLSNALISHFDIHDTTFVWDTAQEVLELVQVQRTEAKYG